MATYLADAELEQELLDRRKASGGDRFDEVWDGVYFMAPIAGNDHQGLAAKLVIVIGSLLESTGGEVFAGVNVSDRADDWRRNYRVPDVAVFLSSNPAINHESHWQGGPDFLIEIESEQDRCREKLPFYAKVGVREVLIVARNPWQLEWYRLVGNQLPQVGLATVDNHQRLTCSVLPLEFSLVDSTPRPKLEVLDPTSGKRWSI